MSAGLKLKIILITTVIVLLATGAVIVSSNYFFAQQQTKALQSRSVAIGENLKAQLEKLLQYGIPLYDLTGFEEQCQNAINAHSGIEYAMVADQQGQILFHSDPQKIGQVLSDPILLTALNADANRVVAHNVNNSGMYSAVIPVHEPDGGHSASVLLGFPKDVISRTVRKIVWMDIVYGLSFLVAGILLLLFFLSLFVTKPLRKLIAATISIQDNQIDGSSLVDIQSEDEIGQLAASFNTMVQRLQRTTVSRDYVENIIHSMTESLIITSTEGVIQQVNEAANTLLGYSNGELLGRQIDTIVETGCASTQEGGIIDEICKDLATNVEKTYLKKDGSRIPVLFSGSVMRGSNGHIQGIVCAALDITEHKMREERLRKTSRALGAIHASNNILTRSENEAQLYQGVCRTVVEKAGYSFAWVGLFPPEGEGPMVPVSWAGDEQGILEEFSQCQEADKEASCPAFLAVRARAPHVENNFLRKIEHSRLIEAVHRRGYQATVGLPLIANNDVLGAMAIYSTEKDSFVPEEVKLLDELASDLAYGIAAIRTRQKRKQAEEKIAYQAYHDSLTGLPNRTKFMQSLDQVLDEIEQRGGEAAVLFIDLDEFKLVNDTLGHSAGDELLRQASQRIQSATRKSDIVSRQGGDEFLVLLAGFGPRKDNSGSGEEAAIVAQRILKMLQSPFKINESDAYVSASIGISLYPNDAKNSEFLIQHADSAMYKAKEMGRSNYQYFSQELAEQHEKKLSLATSLHKGIERQEFVLHYQPVINLQNGRMIGAEALIRWQPENGKLVPPNDFLPVAEDTGMILEIGDWVIREGCRQLQTWNSQGMPLELAINLSVRQMWRGDISAKVLSIINDTGVSKNMLEFEITESAMVADPERMENILRRFHESELRISLDDFGTGYSSLSRLKQLPFSKLKIDKSFVDGVPQDEDNLAIVSATIQMAKSLKLQTLAEGIETAEQWRFLKELGCDYGQGYFFSRPVTATEIEKLCQQGGTWLLNEDAPASLH